MFTDNDSPSLWSKETLEEKVGYLSQQWWTNINKVWEELPVYARRQARRVGAAATFLGVQFYILDETLNLKVPSQVSFRVLAVGDACVFQIRNDAVLCTNQKHNQRGLDNLQIHDGSFQVGDLFLLATDALAEWFICSYIKGEKPWRKIQEISRSEEFEVLIERLREKQVIFDDDTTLMVVKVLAKRKKC
jgi:hypothetical protein